LRDQNIIAMKGHLLLTFYLILSLSTQTFSQTRYFVNTAVAASGDGKSWGSAFKTLQEAIDVSSASIADEVWVAQGTYYPTKTPSGLLSQTSGQVTFFLNKHIKLYGGFNGSETQRDQRNPQTQPTTLSGNINEPDDSTDNAYHVVLISGTEQAPLGNELVIDGFRIVDGYAYYQGATTINGVVLYYYNGGGIYNIYASPVLNNLYISHNNGFVGGGIHNQRSSPVISNSTITGNGYIQASNGGGIYNNAESSPVVTNVVISGNASATGGGVFNFNDSRPVFDQVTITGNAAARGAGMANQNTQPILRNTTISNNIANIDGGGIYNTTQVTLELTNVKIQNNKAQFGGGVRMFRSTLTFTGGEISGNEARNYGGGMYLDGGNLTISGVTISNNKTVTYAGGGIYNVSAGELRISNSTISGNYSRQQGGGIYTATTTVTLLNNVTFTSNEAYNSGGGIYYGGVSASSSISNATFRGNKSSAGGGIACVTSSPGMKSLLFEGNEAEYGGGGISLSSWSSPAVADITLQNNKASSGGGMIITTSSVPTLEDILVKGNTATSDGGGIYISAYGVNPHLNRVLVSANTAENGAGLYIASDAAPILTNTVVTGNRASEAGGGMYIDRARPVLTNLTIGGNFAPSAGGLFAAGSPSTQIRNTIIYGNNSGLDFFNGRPAISNSMIQEFTNTTNNNLAAVNPLFVLPVDASTAPNEGGDFSLQNTSPVIDKGNAALYSTGASPDLSQIRGDYSNNLRIAGLSIDMGAYESGAPSLPVTLISFGGKRTENTVVLEWRSSNEQNSDHFEIMRSEDGKTFASIGTVRASYESNEQVRYEFVDQTPSVNGGYYRLKMIDADGSFAFSRMVRVSADFTVHSPFVFPNPATGTNVSIRHAGKATLVLFDQNGHIVNRAAIGSNETNDLELDISGLKSGNYMLQIADEKQTSTQRLVIIH
jgi:predicted outer membrane repeat protein